MTLTGVEFSGALEMFNRGCHYICTSLLRSKENFFTCLAEISCR